MIAQLECGMLAIEWRRMPADRFGSPITLVAIKGRSLLALLVLAAMLSLTAAAQQKTAPEAQGDANSKPQAKQTEQSKEDQDIRRQQETGTSKDRLFYTLPNFLTVETQVPPLTTKQKFAVVTRSSFDYVEIPWYALLSGISQAENSEPGYGQGAQGYGKRYGAAFADGTLESYMTGAVFPALLRQDPRYYQLGRGGFCSRTGYAVSRIFVTRSDSARKQINFSEIVGSGVAAVISTYSYHPQADRTASTALSVWGTQVGYDTIAIVVKEFWPDIRRKLQKHRRTAQ